MEGSDHCRSVGVDEHCRSVEGGLDEHFRSVAEGGRMSTAG